jgi:hypothetical protein
LAETVQQQRRWTIGWSIDVGHQPEALRAENIDPFCHIVVSSFAVNQSR